MKNLFLICVYLLAAGCAMKTDSKKTLRLAFLTEANSLDPRYGYEIPANHLMKMLFEGLMRMAPDHQIEPAACESYLISKDRKTYTFTIRPARWSNGEKVTAFDFAYAWKWIIDPKTGAKGSSDFYPIKNVQKIVHGELSVESAGIRAIDDRTLVVELEHPTPYFLELTTTSVYSPICSSQDRKDSEWANKTPADFISNGPFLLKERIPNDRILLIRNPSYWNKNQVKIEEIEISIVDNVQTQLALFQANELDWLGKPFSKLPLDAIPSLRDKNSLTLFPEKAVYWYFMNTEKFPFNYTKLRQAFALAINRKEIVEHLLKEDEQPATGLNRPASYFADADLQMARSLFDEALKELNLTKESLPKISLSFCNLEINMRVALVVQQQWEKAFNLSVDLDGQEWVAYYDNLDRGNYQIGGMSWHSRVRDPVYNLYPFKYKNDRLNISRWESKQFQEWLDTAEIQSDPQERLSYLQKAEKLLMNEMPVIPIYYLTLSYAKNPSLEDVYVSDINEIDFTRARKSP